MLQHATFVLSVSTRSIVKLTKLHLNTLIFQWLFADGHTLRGCFRELDEDVQRQCADDNMGMNCTFCENLNTSKDCNNIVRPYHLSFGYV